MTNTISINGKIITTNGSSTTVKNGKVFIDGAIVDSDEKQITILINGNINELSADRIDSIRISGNAGSVNTISGDVSCGDVSGSVKTMSGDILCTAIGGRASSMSGDIKTS